MGSDIVKQAKKIFAQLEDIENQNNKIAIINELRRLICEHSPFVNEPVDCIQWVESGKVDANDYNPNSVAPPEMKLLERSIKEDGFTQPIVAWKVDNGFEVVDGFHRNRVGKESKAVKVRTNGYLPLAVINNDRIDRGNRIASTIRHNRARGKHRVDAMSDIIQELAKRNWSDKRIAKELGMEPDEVLRLKQITGLAEMFADREFSEAWEVEDDPDVLISKK
jgi:ParB-like chromosome segregation protein Spo0J